MNAYLSSTKQESDYRSRLEDIKRTVHIDVGDLGTVDFDAPEEKKLGIIERGKDAAVRYKNKQYALGVIPNHSVDVFAEYDIDDETLFRLPPSKQFDYIYKLLCNPECPKTFIASLMQRLEIPLSLKNESGSTFAHLAVGQGNVKANVKALEKILSIGPNCLKWEDYSRNYPYDIAYSCTQFNNSEMKQFFIKHLDVSFSVTPKDERVAFLNGFFEANDRYSPKC